MPVDLPEDELVVEQAPLPAGVTGSLKFDWVFLALSGWLVAGVYVDGWAHNNINLVDTFFTPWHALLYSGYVAVSTFLVATVMRNHPRGYAWERALPPGYGLSLLGVAIFGIGGVADFFWHTLFGFEVELAILLSPTHLTLAAGGFLIVSGPLRAAWARAEDAEKAPGRSRLLSQLPMILSLTCVLSALSFMTSFAHPFVTLPATNAYEVRGSGPYIVYLNDLVEGGGVLSILLQTGLLMGTILVAIRRQRLPLGSFVIMFTLNLTLACVLVGNYFLIPVAVLSGLAADGLYWYLKPSVARPGELRLFTFIVPVFLFSLYLLDLRLFKSVWWPINIWLGSIVLSGAVGLLLSYLFVSPLKRAGQVVSASFRLTRRRVVVGLASLGLVVGGLVVLEDIVARRTGATAGFPDTGTPTTFLYGAAPLATINVSTLQYYAGSAVNSVAWSPDGRVIASANADGTVQLWPAARTANAARNAIDRPLLTYGRHGGAVTDLAWLPGGTYIVSASEDGTAQVWDARTGVARLVYRGHVGSVFSISCAPGGRHIATAGQDRTVQIWDAATGVRVFTYRGHVASVITVRWSPDGERLASASSDGEVRIWNASTGALLASCSVGKVNGGNVPIEWSPDGKSVATAVNNLSVWDASTGLLLSQYNTAPLSTQTSNVLNMAWSPDGKRLVTTQDDSSVYVWSTSGSQTSSVNVSFGDAHGQSGADALFSGGGAVYGTIILYFAGHTAAVTAVAWSLDGRSIVSAGEDQTVQVWDTSIGTTIVTYSDQNVLPDGAWSSSNGGMIASPGNNGIVLIWDAATGKTLLTYKGHPAKSTVGNIAWSPDDKRIVSASSDGTVLIWGVVTGTTLLTYLQSEQKVVGLTWLDGGKRVALVNQDGQIRVLDAMTGRILLTTQKQEAGASTVDWSPNKSRLALVNNNGYLQVWDALTGAELLPPLVHLGAVQDVTWSPDGRQLACGGNGEVRVLDGSTGDVLLTCGGVSYAPGSISWSPDNRRIAFTSTVGTQVWDKATQTLLLTYQGMNWDSSQPSSAAWSPDGKRIASASGGGSIQVWLAAE